MTLAASTAGLHRFIATLLSTSRKRLLQTASVGLALTLTEGAGLLLLLPLIQLVGVDAGRGDAGGLGGIIAKVFAWAGLQPTLVTVLLVYVGMGALNAGLVRWQALLTFDVQQDVVSTLRKRLYRAIVRTEWVVFARMRVSEFTHVLTTDVERSGFVAYYVIDLVSGAAVCGVYLALAFRLSPGMTVLLFGCGAALAWIVRGRLARSTESGRRFSAATSTLLATITEHLGGLKTAKSYDAESRHAELFVEASDAVRMSARRSVLDQAGLRHALTLGSLASLAGIVYVSRTILLVPTAPLLVLLFLAARSMPKLTVLYEKSQALAAVLPSFDAVCNLERRCLDAAEASVAEPMPVQFDRTLTFDHVTFDYSGADRPALNDLTLEISAGRTTAIVGPSGAGKSTIADMLLGLLTPTMGRIVVDAQPLGPHALSAWRRQIGYVAQDTFIFHDTIRANLLWAEPHASEADLWRALQRASADAFVSALPNGLDTVVGDRGVLISGGERQRLALARALVRQPKLLVLDEATSALDSENEARVQRAIDSLRHDQTIVIITHRLSAIRNVDLIHVMDRGRVVESGTWQELSARVGGRFRALCDTQGLSGLHDHQTIAGLARNS